MIKYASVVVLSLERPKVLRWSLESLQQHTHYPHELIVHDDGSADSHVREFLLEQLASGGISSLVLNPPGRNMAIGQALNRTLPMCTGKYIASLSGDYQYRDGWLEEAVELLEAFPEASIVSLDRSHNAAYDLLTFMEYRTRQGLEAELRWAPGTSLIAFRRSDLEAVWPIEILRTPTAEHWSLVKALCPGAWHTATPQPKEFEGPWCISPIRPKVSHPPANLMQGVSGIYDPEGKLYRRPVHRCPLLRGEVPFLEGALWNVDNAPLLALGTGSGNRYLLGLTASTGTLLKTPLKHDAPPDWRWPGE